MRIDADPLDAFCFLQQGFSDQFVYYDKRAPVRYLGLGRCIALPSVEAVAYVCAGPCDQSPVYFSFNRFDAANPAPCDELSAAFPQLRFMLPELVLIENEHGRMLQVNSLGPVHEARASRFARLCAQAPARTHVSVPYELEVDSREEWLRSMDEARAALRAGRVDKVVLSRRKRLKAFRPFSAKDLVANLVDGDAYGTVLLYRYADAFFCGCTPELLVRKRGDAVESMCLAGTCPSSSDSAVRERLAASLMSDAKNRAEHDYVVRFVRDVFARVCYDVDVPSSPGIMRLPHVQHLFTPARARALEGVDLPSLADDLHPTPATCGMPVGEARMLIRRIERYNRGFYAGAAGFVDGAGNGEFSVALRSGVFDGFGGWVYAGCGIVEESDADAEYDEIDLKLKTILSAFSA